MPAALMSLMLACAVHTGPRAPADAGCGLAEPLGHVAQYTPHPAADPPRRCVGAGGGDRGHWIRVEGAGTRQLAMGRGVAGDPACNTPDADPTACPIVQVDAFGMDVLARLRAALGPDQADGLGMGLCGEIGPIDAWNMGVRIHDWRHADAAVSLVVARMAAWDLGGEFGVSVSGISCAVPL